MNKKSILILLILSVLTLAVYWDVQQFDFIHYDDVSYIRDNNQVRSGLTLRGFMWALTDIHTGYWHPLTWFSHMLDWQLFGFHAGGHHWSSVVIHLCNTLLLFVILQKMTGESGRSAFVAALFALHPLNVESVAWVAERKNVLSTFCGFLATYLYILYTKKPWWGRYMLVFLAFAAGLMAKPMLVTFPFLLLLLDFWPLRRFSYGASETARRGPLHAIDVSRTRLIVEKMPLLVLSLAVSLGTLWAGRHEGAVKSLVACPIGARMANAVISYTAYIEKMIWPSGLVVFYPYPASYPVWQVAGSAAALSAVSLAVILPARKYPYLLMGWLWYIGTLVPVIGLVQAGDQAMADRYAYVPLIGLFVMIAWGVPDLAARWRWRGGVLAVAVVAALAGLIVCTHRQLQYWRSSISLFQHALDASDANYLAHNNLGIALMESGRLDEAMNHFGKVLEMNPRYARAHNNMGVALLYQGRPAAAASHLQQALQANPRYAEAHSNLGISLAEQGKPAEAALHFREALRINPSFSDARQNLDRLERQFGAGVCRGRDDERR